MNLRSAYISMIRGFPGGWDAMCAALAMSRDQLENRIYERKGQGLGVETALQIQAFSGTKLFAESVATASGGTFVMLPDVSHISNEAISKKFLELYEELGSFSREFSDATADEVVDEREQRRINDVVDDIHRTLNEIRALTFTRYCKQTKANSEATNG